MQQNLGDLIEGIRRIGDEKSPSLAELSKLCAGKADHTNASDLRRAPIQRPNLETVALTQTNLALSREPRPKGLVSQRFAAPILRGVQHRPLSS